MGLLKVEIRDGKHATARVSDATIRGYERWAVSQNGTASRDSGPGHRGRVGDKSDCVPSVTDSNLQNPTLNATRLAVALRVHFL